MYFGVSHANSLFSLLLFLFFSLFTSSISASHKHKPNGFDEAERILPAEDYVHFDVSCNGKFTQQTYEIVWTYSNILAAENVEYIVFPICEGRATTAGILRHITATPNVYLGTDKALGLALILRRSEMAGYYHYQAGLLYALIRSIGSTPSFEIHLHLPRESDYPNSYYCSHTTQWLIKKEEESNHLHAGIQNISAPVYCF
jgi:hypothetical protein